jgi:2-polyprenyl-6-methoxyphenol hydroxylase-like FAD-dependent oxidoreductase
VTADSRTFQALTKIPGLEGIMANKGVYCVGMCLHGAKKTRAIPKDPPNLLVDRNQIVMTLLQELAQAELASNTTISMQFHAALQDVNLDSKEITIVNEKNKLSKIPFDYLVAADGGRSKIRQQLVDTGALKCSQKEIPNEYRVPAKMEAFNSTRTSSTHGCWIRSKSSPPPFTRIASVGPSFLTRDKIPLPVCHPPKTCWSTFEASLQILLGN